MRTTSFQVLGFGLSSEIVSPPKLELVVQDCDEVLKFDFEYVRTLNNLATASALEKPGHPENGLRRTLPRRLFWKNSKTLLLLLELERLLKVMTSGECIDCGSLADMVLTGNFRNGSLIYPHLCLLCCFPTS